MKKILLFFCVFTIGLTAFSQIPNYVPANGLVGWWPFNGNANDDSGNGNNGTVNGAILTSDRFGNVNQAYGFDGNNDFIDCGNNPSINIIGSVTISGWINANNLNGEQGIVSKMNTGIATYELITSNSLLRWMDIGGFLFSNSINPNEWLHIVSVFDNTLLLKSIYINGELNASSNSSVSTIPINLDNLYIGAHQPSVVPGWSWDGRLDDIGIWNRALTECEIQDLYLAQLNSTGLNISAGADQSICSGDSITLIGAGGSNYQWNNNVVDGQAFSPIQSNAYVVNGTDTLGCQGTDTVVVTVLENATSTLTETALDSYTLNGQTYTQSGTYTQTLTAANGCDSTITLNLTLNYTGMDEFGTNAKKLVKITDLNGKVIPRRKNTLMLFIFEDGTVERVVEMEE